MPGPAGNSQPFRELIAVLAAAFLTLLVYVVAQGEALTNSFMVNDDVRQQVYWMQKWIDASLYPPDLLNGYAQQYVPWGVKALYRAAVPVVDPLMFSKILTGFTFTALGTLIFMTCRLMGSRSLGWAGLSTYWLMPYFLDTMSGGLARSFAFPLLAMFMLGWFTGKPWVLVSSLLLQSLLIPYVFPLCLAAVLVSWLLFGIRRMPPAVPLKPAYIVAILSAAAIVVMMKHSFDLQAYGPLVSRREMAGNPLFTAAGRYEIAVMPAFLKDLVVTPWEWIGGFHELGTVGGIVTTVLTVGIAVVGLCFVEWHPLGRFLPPVAIVATASLGMYLLAYVVLLRLFIPDRYVMYTINLYYCVLLALAFHALWARCGRKRVAGVCLVAAAMVAGACRLDNVGVTDYSADKTLYDALAATPPSTRVAAHPWLADSILTFARRNVVVSCELAHPWSVNYWREIETRLSDFFDAYYAHDPAVVRAFCRKYAVDVLVVDARHFEPAFVSGQPFFAPFDNQIRNLAASGGEFYLAQTNGFDSVRISRYQKLVDARSIMSVSVRTDAEETGKAGER